MRFNTCDSKVNCGSMQANDLDNAHRGIIRVIKYQTKSCNVQVYTDVGGMKYLSMIVQRTGYNPIAKVRGLSQRTVGQTMV